MSLIEWIDFQVLGDSRGGLVSIEQNTLIPFEIKRVYYIYDTAKDVSRGFHAHRELKQVAICISGSCRMVFHNGLVQEEYILDTPTKGVLIDGLLWREMHDFSENCILLVLASEHFDESDYIRDFTEFKTIANHG